MFEQVPYIGLTEDVGWESCRKIKILSASINCAAKTASCISPEKFKSPRWRMRVARWPRRRRPNFCGWCGGGLHAKHDKAGPWHANASQNLILTLANMKFAFALNRDNGLGWGIFASLQPGERLLRKRLRLRARRAEKLYAVVRHAVLQICRRLPATGAPNYDRLRAASATFRDCFYDTTLPAEVVESVAANLAILKSPTCLRQADGRLWGWEGCFSGGGCCHGTCTHVWNYAQSIPHLFPDLERTLRETEFS